MKEINQSDIKKYLDDSGTYIFEKDIRLDGKIDFDKPVVFRGAAYFIGNAYFSDNSYFDGNAYFRDYIYSNGNTNFLENAEFYGNVYSHGNIYSHGNAEFCCNIYSHGNAYFDGTADFSGNAEFHGEYIVVKDTMYWSHASIPKFPEKHYVKLLMPQKWQKDHYKERFGFDITSRHKKIGKKVFNLLEDEKWLPLERKMLECIRDYEKKEPEWVKEISAKKEAAA